MAFSFNSIAQVKPNTTSHLKPYTINNNVTIKGTEIKEGSKDGKAWKSLIITFGNDEGIYNDSTFFLDINDPQISQRGTREMPNGGEKQTPSRWEQVYYKLAAIGFAFAPDYMEAFQKNVDKCKTFDDFITLYKSMIDKVIGKNPTGMKLIGRNHQGTVYAALPNCVGIAQATDEKRAEANNVEVGDWYTWIVSPFGDNLFFSAYEENQKNTLSKAKPTDMDKARQAIDGTGAGSEDTIDFNKILG